MAAELFAGVDVGTSSVKAVLTRPDGTVVASSSTPTPWRVQRGAVRAEPMQLAGAVTALLRELAVTTTGRVAGVGVTGFAESGVMLDAAGEPSTPVIPWYDEAGELAEEELRQDFGSEGFMRRTGQPVRRRLSIVKYRWLREKSGARLRGGRWLTVPEWIVLSLGGSPVPELSLWSRTGFLCIDRPVIDEELAAWAGLPMSEHDEPRSAGHPCGTVSALPELAGAMLTVAGHDHVCAAYGAGVVDEQRIFDSWGNGEALLRAKMALPDPALAWTQGCSVSWHVSPERWTLFAGLGTGLILRRVLGLLGMDAHTRGRLDEQALELPEERLPRVEISTEGTVDILDVPDGAGPAALWRAALQAAFDRVQQVAERIGSSSGAYDAVVGCGGWLRSRELVLLKSQRVRRFNASPLQEPAAVGAALLAGVASQQPATRGGR